MGTFARGAHPLLRRSMLAVILSFFAAVAIRVGAGPIVHTCGHYLSPYRQLMRTVSIGQKALFWGGNSGSSYVNNWDVYDGATNTWYHGTYGPIEIGWHRGLEVAVGSVGLFVVTNSASPATEDRGVYKWDAYAGASGTFSFVPNVRSNPCTFPAMTSTQLFGGKAFVIGGKSGTYACPNIYVYTASTNVWSETNMTQARFMPFAGVLDDVLIIGAGAWFGIGSQPSQTTWTNAERYNLTTQRWMSNVTIPDAVLPAPYWGFWTTAWKQKMYIIAGTGGTEAMIVYDGALNAFEPALLSCLPNSAPSYAAQCSVRIPRAALASSVVGLSADSLGVAAAYVQYTHAMSAYGQLFMVISGPYTRSTYDTAGGYDISTGQYFSFETVGNVPSYGHNRGTFVALQTASSGPLGYGPGTSTVLAAGQNSSPFPSEQDLVSFFQTNGTCPVASGCSNVGTLACSQQCGGTAWLCTCKTGYAGTYCSTDTNECASQPCLNGGTCTDGFDQFVCACVGGYTGARCQTNIDECASLPCANGGTCYDRLNAFNCTCPIGTAGRMCETSVNECVSQPCVNGGTCVDAINGYSCICPSGYVGATCQTDFNECASQPCTNGGTCGDSVNRFTCSCVPGYNGVRCQNDINECTSTPCQNGGTCANLINRFACTCSGGYSGLQCETNVDECTSLPCQNAGSCADAVNGFTCTCAAGYSGLLCQTDVNECVSNPCQNAGTCLDLVAAFTCVCRPGYSGILCTTNVNECSSTPCQNGGTCSDAVNRFTCACAAGYSGLTCETEIDECASNPCVGGAATGTCVDRVNGFVCECASGYSGRTCVECASSPCQRGGTCVDRIAGFECTCVPGASGVLCETDINECASQPCLNGATCIDSLNRFTCGCVLGFSGLFCQTKVENCASQPCVHGSCFDVGPYYGCTCANGFSGVHCETEINECASAPCANGGTCVDAVAEFSCICRAGFSGRLCETDIDECVSGPCTYGGTCVDALNGFTCLCAAGYSGFACETDVNDCASLPCQHAGTCVDAINGYTCVCAAGQSGAMCETDINECASSPCYGASTCVDLVARYACTCEPGRSGINCETNINECASNPCRVGTTCVDSINGYTCVCPAGRSGLRCETDIDECSSQPCAHGGTCVDGDNHYQCTCAHGYTGFDCRTDVNECSSRPCRNSGTCVDAVNGYSCICAGGYSGAICQTEIDECASQPCGGVGICTDAPNAFQCLCPDGLSGAQCQTDVNECASSPCENGGTCADHLNRFSCHCVAGVFGSRCELNATQCTSASASDTTVSLFNRWLRTFDPASTPVSSTQVPWVAVGVAVDRFGAVYSAGYSPEANVAVYLKYGAAGVTVWTSINPGHALTTAGAFAVDYNSGAVFGAAQSTLRLDTANGVQLWYVANPSSFTASAIAFDPSTASLYECGAIVPVGPAVTQFSVLRVRASDGGAVWLRTFEYAPVRVSPVSIAVSAADGGLYLLASLTNLPVSGSFAGQPTGTATAAAALFKLTSVGTIVWTRLIGPGIASNVPSVSVVPYAVMPDPLSTDVFVGLSTTYAGFDGVRAPSNGNWAIARYRADGTKWSTLFAGSATGGDTVSAFTIDRENGFVYATGHTATGTFDPAHTRGSATVPFTGGGRMLVVQFNRTALDYGAILTATALANAALVAPSPLSEVDTFASWAQVLAPNTVATIPVGLAAATARDSDGASGCSAHPVIAIAAYGDAWDPAYQSYMRVIISPFSVTPVPPIHTATRLCPACSNSAGKYCPVAFGTDPFPASACAIDECPVPLAACDANFYCPGDCQRHACPPTGNCPLASVYPTCSLGYTGNECQSTIDECSSQPCLSGGTCVDGINQFTCLCRAGRTGRVCETDMNECASQPCMNGGTCHDGDNQFACTCTTEWTGTRCDIDVNECATANGGCMSLSNCTNLAPGYECTPYIVPGSIVPRVLPGTAAPLNVSFVLAGPPRGADLTTLLLPISVGPYACASVQFGAASSVLAHPITCHLAGGVGTGHALTVTRTASPQPFVASSSVNAELVSFPAPVIYAQTLRGRLNPVTQPPAPRGSAGLRLASTAYTTLYFDGANFSPDLSLYPQSVFYGDRSTPLAAQYPCVVDPAVSTPRVIACRTVAGSTGTALVFTVVVGNQNVTGTDELIFPVSPFVKTVRGCASANGNGTADCDTAGTDWLVIAGSNFANDSSLVVVGRAACANLTVGGAITSQFDVHFGTIIRCRLPAGTGSPLLTVTSLGVQIAIAGAVTYAMPVITSLSSTNCANALDAAGALHLVTCPRTADSVITVRGTNFGVAGAAVLIGAASTRPTCVHSAAAAHSELVCVLSGGGRLTNQAVVVLQSGARLGSSAATLSFAACGAGTQPSSDSTSNVCDACAAGSYNSVPSLPCVLCPTGKIAASAGATGCTACEPNAYSPSAGGTACRACPLNTYQPQFGGAECVACDSGQYYSVASASCLSCPSTAACALNRIEPRGSNFVYLSSGGDLRSESCLPGYCRTCDEPAAVGTSASTNTSAITSDASSSRVFTCCAANRVPNSVRCGTCEDGYVQSGGAACVECRHANVPLIVQLLIASWLWVTIYYVLAQSASSESRIAINFLQFVFIILVSQSGSIVGWLGLFNFNLFRTFDGGGSCLWPFSDMQLLLTGLWTPLVSLGLLALNSVFHYIAWRFIGKTRLCPASCIRPQHAAPCGCLGHPAFGPVVVSYQRAAIGFVASSYPSISQTVLAFFSCIESGDGDGGGSYLQAYPSISCSGTEYRTLYPLFVVLLMLVVAFPILVFARLYQLNRSGSLMKGENRIVYGVLFDTYSPSRYAWECFVLARRLVVSVVCFAPSLIVDSSRRFTFLALVHVLFFGIQSAVRPYQSAIDNASEELSVLTLAILCVSVLGFAAGSGGTEQQLSAGAAVGLSVMCLGVAALFGLRLFASRYDRLRFVCSVACWKCRGSCPHAYCPVCCTNSGRTPPVPPVTAQPTAVTSEGTIVAVEELPLTQVGGVVVSPFAAAAPPDAVSALEGTDSLRIARLPTAAMRQATVSPQVLAAGAEPQPVLAAAASPAAGGGSTPLASPTPQAGVSSEHPFRAASPSAVTPLFQRTSTAAALGIAPTSPSAAAKQSPQHARSASQPAQRATATITPSVILILAFACVCLTPAASAFVVPGNWTSPLVGDQLSVARSELSVVAAGPVFVFAGGRDGVTTAFDTVDLYNTRTGVWSTNALSGPRYAMDSTSAGARFAVFGGGITDASVTSNAVDVYDALSDVWWSTAFPGGTYRRFGAATSVVPTDGQRTIVLFAGGYSAFDPIDTVDRYDPHRRVWLPSSVLTVARSYLAASTYRHRAYFAGGLTIAGTETNAVDMYDGDTDTWSVATPLLQARFELVATTVGPYILFAFGRTTVPSYSATVDIVDATTGAVSLGVPASSGRSGLSATSDARYAYFSTGLSAPGFDVFDSVTLQWSTITPLRHRSNGGAAAAGDLTVFAAGSDDGTGLAMGGVEIYNSAAPALCPLLACENAAVCRFVASTPVCDCLPGFSGAKCQTDTNECASSPCRNGGTCVDHLNSFACACSGGWNGTRCEIDVACSVAPCQNGGTCNLLTFQCACAYGWTGQYCDVVAVGCQLLPCTNGGVCTDFGGGTFNCLCPPQWSGAQCQSDVDECSVSNGQCITACSNLVPYYSCLPFVVPNSVVAVGFGSTSAASTVRFRITAPHAPPFDLSTNYDYYIGPIPCNVVSFPLESPAAFPYVNRTVECSLPNGGAGIGLPVRVIDTGSNAVVATSTGPDTVSFPPPTIAPSSLRLAFGGAVATHRLAIATPASTIITFDGTNFSPDLVRFPQSVRYGPPSDPLRYTCEPDPSRCTSTTIVCHTEADSSGVAAFTVCVALQCTNGTDSAVFPIPPSVTSVTGCAIGGCSTAGGDAITIFGANFDPASSFVSVGGSECVIVSINTPATQLVCAMPAGTALPSVAVTAQAITVLVPSAIGASVLYGLPVVTQLIGCVSTATANRIVGCSRTAVSAVTIFGANFGPFGTAQVYVGAARPNCTQSLATPHTTIVCSVEPDRISEQTVLVLQLNAGVGTSLATLSFATCNAGEREAGAASTAGASPFQCELCPAGSANPTPGGECTLCPAGRYAALNGSLTCTACAPDSYAPANGATACVGCPPNQFQPQNGSVACLSCSIGQYFSQSVGECAACPDTVSCTPAAIAPRGNYYSFLSSSGEMESIACASAGACVACDSSSAADAGAGAASGVYTCCGAHRVAGSPLCGTCDSGYSLLGTECGACASPNGGAVVLVLLLLCLTVGMFAVGIANPSSTPATRIFFHFVQLACAFMSLDQPAAGSTTGGGALQWWYLFQFNPLLAVTHLGVCVWPLSGLQRLASGVWMPLLALCVIGIAAAVVALVRRCQRKCECGRDALNSCDASTLVRICIGYSSAAYYSLCASVLAFFARVNVNGVSVLIHYPDVDTSAPEYTRVYPLFVVLAIAVTATPILVATRLTYLWMSARNKLVSLKPDAESNAADAAGVANGDYRYGAWEDGYAPAQIYTFGWETVLFIWRLIAAAVVTAPQFVNSPNLQFTYLAISCLVFGLLHVQLRPFDPIVLSSHYLSLLSHVALSVLCAILIAPERPLSDSAFGGAAALCYLTAGAVFVAATVERVRAGASATGTL